MCNKDAYNLMISVPMIMNADVIIFLSVAFLQLILIISQLFWVANRILLFLYFNSVPLLAIGLTLLFT